MAALTCAILVVICAGCVLAIPSSLLTEVKQAELSHARLPNKVKRAQEVIMFGNQQNRGGEGRSMYSLPRTEKRGIQLDDESLPSEPATDQPQAIYPSDDDEAMEEPKVLARYDKNYRGEPDYAQKLQNSVLKPEYYMDPATLTDLRYYDLDERRKRDTFRTPSKRISRGLTSARAKRDLVDLTPEDFLALLNREYDRRNNHQQTRNMDSQYSMVEPDDNSEGENDIIEEEEPRPDGWMDGPVSLPTRHFNTGGEPWGRQRQFEDRRKRFMVSKRRPQDGEIYSLAQLLNGPQRDLGTPVFRRYVL